MIGYGNAGYLLRKMAADSEDDHTVRNAALAALGIGGLGAGGYGVKKLIDARKAAQRASKVRKGLKGLGGLAALGLLGGGGYALSQNPEIAAKLQALMASSGDAGTTGSNLMDTINNATHGIGKQIRDTLRFTNDPNPGSNPFNPVLNSIEPSSDDSTLGKSLIDGLRKLKNITTSGRASGLSREQILKPYLPDVLGA